MEGKQRSSREEGKEGKLELTTVELSTKTSLLPAESDLENLIGPSSALVAEELEHSLDGPSDCRGRGEGKRSQHGSKGGREGVLLRARGPLPPPLLSPCSF